MSKTKLRHALALVLLLAAGLGLMLLYADRKSGYHVDELYTYELANYPGGFYALQDGYLDTWHDGALYQSALTAGEPFNYEIPWNNQKIDVHPPLYYCVIYTAESLFPQLGLPWVGLLPNFVFCLAGALVLYAAARRLTGRFWPSWLAAAVWLLSVGVQSMAVFTRMYAMMMLEGLLLVLAHLVLYQGLCAGKRPRLVWLGFFAVTLAGALTQYFFLVFCFFFCGVFGLWLLAGRRWRTAALYAGVEFGALAAAYLAFPTMKQHIFSGSRGAQAVSSFLDPAALGSWAASLWRVFNLLGDRFGGLALWAAVLAAAAIVLWRRGLRPRGAGLFALGLALASLAYIVVIDKAAPFEADRYYVVVYGPLALAFITVLARVTALYPKRAPLLALALAPVLAAHYTAPNEYLYTDYAPRAGELAETAALPAVVLNQAGYDVAPDLFVQEFAAREAVYQASGQDDAASLLNAVRSYDVSGGFVLYGYIYDADELLALAEQVLDIREATLLTTLERCPVYYIVLNG